MTHVDIVVFYALGAGCLPLLLALYIACMVRFGTRWAEREGDRLYAIQCAALAKRIEQRTSDLRALAERRHVDRPTSHH